MHIAYVPEYENQNNVIGWFATITDITERKRAEEASMRLAAIVSTSTDAIVSKTLDGDYHELERERAADVWLHGGGNHPSADFAFDSARTSR